MSTPAKIPMPYEVHLCPGCIDMLLNEHNPYCAHDLLVVEVTIDQCDNGLIGQSGYNQDIYNTVLDERNSEFDPNADDLMPRQITIFHMDAERSVEHVSGQS